MALVSLQLTLNFFILIFLEALFNWIIKSKFWRMSWNVRYVEVEYEIWWQSHKISLILSNDCSG